MHFVLFSNLHAVKSMVDGTEFTSWQTDIDISVHSASTIQMTSSNLSYILYSSPGLIKSCNFICNDLAVNNLFIRHCRILEKALEGFPLKKISQNLSKHLKVATRFNGEAKVNVTFLSEENIPLRATSDQILYCCGVSWTLINDCLWQRWVNWAKPHLMNQKMKWLLLGRIDSTGWYTYCSVLPKVNWTWTQKIKRLSRVKMTAGSFITLLKLPLIRYVKRFLIIMHHHA